MDLPGPGGYRGPATGVTGPRLGAILCKLLYKTDNSDIF